MDRVVAGYPVLAATALAFPHRPAAWAPLLLGHILLAGALLALLIPAPWKRLR